MTSDGSRYAAVCARAEQGTRAAAGGPTLPEGARLVVSFTYTLLSGWGLIRNPKVAVWIEDADGHLVRTVLLQGHEGLRTMAQWYAVLGNTETTTSSTKPAGSTSIEWDGTDDAGRRVPQGDYHVCIEASRDNGPRELVRQRLTLGTTRGTQYLPASGELVSAAVFYSGAPG